MPVTVSAGARAAILERLQAAGCVFAAAEADLLIEAAGSADELDRLTARRTAGEPLEQVVGWAEFCGLHLTVRPGVFVPRRRTELLVREAIRRLDPGDVALDLCCGCGAIAAAIAAVRPVELYAAELDPVAADCARHNLGADIPVYVGDGFSPVPERLRGRVAVVTANVPYVPTGELELMPAEARLHEPREALDGGDDGLAVLARIAAEAPAWLRPGGWLLSEVSERQAPAAGQIVEAAGLVAMLAHDDELAATVVAGQRRSDQ